MLEQWSKTNAVDPTPAPNPFPQDWIDVYINLVYALEITTEKLDPAFHAMTTSYLLGAAYKGFGNPPDAFTQGSAEWDTITGIKRNIFQFSAAKQYQQVLTMSHFIFDGGLKTPYADFRKLADRVFDEYNKNYLKTEYITAVGQAQSARDWAYFVSNKATHPWLKYHTQQDDRVRDEHKVLDGFTAKIDDPAWRHIAPKNGWRCRCFLTAHEKGRRTKKELPEFGTKEFPAVFDMNPGTDKLIFDPTSHPYFKVQRGDGDLKKRNFNLPVD